MSIKPTDFYITKAKARHSNRYDYSLILSLDKSNDHVDIICPLHGVFNQRFDHHIRGAGCSKCWNRGRQTKEYFLENANLVHGNKYNYNFIDYVNKNTKIKIICPIHGEFFQSPHQHLNGLGCQRCSGYHRLSINDFIIKSKEKHDDKYDYSLVDYINNSTEVKIICKDHGEFKQLPSVHFLGSGCPICGLKKRSENNPRKHDNKWFLEESKRIHGDKYDYSLIKYENLHSKLIIVCKIHGVFSQSASKHILRKHGCPKCGGSNRRTNDEFIKEAKETHGNTYDYSLVDYKNKESKVKIICPNHGVFEQVAHNHIWGEQGCSRCSLGQKSKIEQKWLDDLRIPLDNRNVSIKVNGKLFKVDGFDSNTKTIYEFYGDFYHGNPKRYNPLDTNPINKMTYGKLYQRTLKRGRIIKKAGFNLITIWESEYLKLSGMRPY